MPIVFMIFMVSLGFTGTITVNSPNGGENLGLGSRSLISWSGMDLTNPVKIVLWKRGVLVGLIVKDQPASGSYSWTVGSYVGGTAIVSSDYKIKIREQGGVSFTTEDTSNAGFSIVEVPAVEIHRSNPLRLSKPNGRESWEKKSRKTISWTNSGRYLGTIKLLLFKNDREMGVIATNLPYSPYSFSWEVGRHSNGLASAGTDYKIRVSSPSNHNIDFSNSSFTIVDKPGTLTALRPVIELNNRTNRDLGRVSRLQIRLPDLSISDVEMNLQKAGSDRKSSFAFKIKNIGNGDCRKSFKVKIKIHKFFYNDVFYKVVNLRPIAAGRDREIRFQYKFINCCGFLLTIETDYQNKIIEKSEQNNKKEAHINLEKAN